MDEEGSWSNTRTSPKLTRNDVHVWRCDLNQSDLIVGKLKKILSEKEKDRINQFRFEKDQKQFIISRGTLRKILSEYLNTRPDLIEFSYGLFGKPYLVKKHRDTGIQFNLAHSNEVTIYAMTKNRKVGIDIEFIREIALDEMIERFFSKNEKTKLKMLSEIEKKEVFFKYWTRKEALQKAIGNGFTTPLTEVDTSIFDSPNSQNFVLNSNYFGNWFMHSFSPRNGYIATLVVEGGIDTISFLQY